MVIAAAGVGAVAYLLRGDAMQTLNATGLSVGEKYLVELNYEQATATLQNVITVEPNNTEAYLSLSKAYSYMGDIDIAHETLQKGYVATNSSVIERALSELSGANTSPTGGQITTAAPNVEISGHIYRADVTELVLRECGLTDADMQKLTEFTNLERLDISGNGITDIGAIAGLSTLKKLYAANNAITDITPLANIQSLEYIGLRGNQIVAADDLFALNGLRYLHLSENMITSIPNAGDELQLLYLAGNQINDTAVLTEANLLYCDVIENPVNER